MSDDMRSAGEGGTGADVSRHALRRALVLSVAFPLVAWFFGSWVGLSVSILAVGVWWTTNRPARLYWPVAVALLAATPIAVWAQGLPQTPVVGATFGVRHWVANDLVISALTIASFAALVELAHLDDRRRGESGLPASLGLRIASRMKAWAEREPRDGMRAPPLRGKRPPRGENTGSGS